MNKQSFDDTMNTIVEAIEAGGHSAAEQIGSFLLTGDPTYITRRNNARQLILTLDNRQIGEYLQSILKK